MPDGINSNGAAPRSDPAAELARLPAVPAAAHAPSPAPVVQPPAPTQDLRLNIERDQASGQFIYKFVDPKTGQVIQQIPNEEILRMRTAAEYAAGRVVDTRA
ncbi:MAG: flagellar protein FlaG [Alphaproteobacteria bacterium]|nr:flagellar protein FlaG [Alphaproteobacteria bacterium]